MLYYTPKAVSSHWDEALKAHLVPFKQLPFLVSVFYTCLQMFHHYVHHSSQLNWCFEGYE